LTLSLPQRFYLFSFEFFQPLSLQIGEDLTKARLLRAFDKPQPISPAFLLHHRSENYTAYNARSDCRAVIYCNRRDTGEAAPSSLLPPYNHIIGV